MTKDESKRQILLEWENWAPDPSKGTYDDMQKFYQWLEKNRPDLLQWKIREGMDLWQVVHGWLNQRTHYGGV